MSGANGWRPIEDNPPKDGTRIDLWAVYIGPAGEGRRLPDCFWGVSCIPFEENSEGEGWCSEHEGIDGNECLIDPDIYTVTHWMPLPEPPTSDVLAGEGQMATRAIAHANDRDDLADAARLSAPTASAVAKVLTMLNTWFRHRSSPPAYREIAALSGGVTLSRVRGYLDKLQEQGHLTHTPGVERSVVMTDRCANICDDELERACHGRNWTIIKHPVGEALGLAFPLAPALPVAENAGGTDCGHDFGVLLGKIA